MKFETYVSGKGEGTNRYQFMQVLVMLVEAAHLHNRINIYDVMKHLDCSEQFAKDLMNDLVDEGVAKWSSSYKGHLDFNYNFTSYRS